MHSETLWYTLRMHNYTYSHAFSHSIHPILCTLTLCYTLCTHSYTLSYTGLLFINTLWSTLRQFDTFYLCMCVNILALFHTLLNFTYYSLIFIHFDAFLDACVYTCISARETTYFLLIHFNILWDNLIYSVYAHLYMFSCFLILYSIIIMHSIHFYTFCAYTSIHFGTQW